MKREWMTEKTIERKLLVAGCFYSLKELENLPDSEGKIDLLHKLDAVRQIHNPNDKYGKNGSRFDNDFLEDVQDAIIMYPLEFMSDFISEEHKNKVDNNDEEILSAFSTMIKSPDLYTIFSFRKPHLIGLAAYIILNVKDEYIFNSALEFLELNRKYFMACLSDNVDELHNQMKEHKEWLKTLN